MDHFQGVPTSTTSEDEEEMMTVGSSSAEEIKSDKSADSIGELVKLVDKNGESPGQSKGENSSTTVGSATFSAVPITSIQTQYVNSLAITTLNL